MGAINDFIASRFFFPILIGLVLMLVLIFVIILITGKRKLKKEEEEEAIEYEGDYNPLEDLNKFNVQNTKKNNVFDRNIETPQIKKETNVDPMSSLKENKTIEKPKADLNIEDIIVKIPVNKMDDMPVSLPVEQKTFDDIGETVDIEVPESIGVENIPSDEIVEIPEIDCSNLNDVGESVEIPSTTPLIEIEGEMVSLPSELHFYDDKKDIKLAFDTIPTSDHYINEQVKVEGPKEYVGEKTEMFDISSIVNETNNTNKEIINLSNAKIISQNIIKNDNKIVINTNKH